MRAPRDAAGRLVPYVGLGSFFNVAAMSATREQLYCVAAMFGHGAPSANWCAEVGNHRLHNNQPSMAP